MSMKFLGALRQELDRTRYRRIENDLYSLNQTDDLANYDAAKFPNLVKFRDFVKTDVLQWLKSVSKIDLNSDVAITGSCYKNTDLLLPHDDQCEGRAIAFVLYLSPNWEEADGGQLVLYETDDQNNPKSIVKSMNPVENTLLLFPVSPRSWHMVTEVTSQKERISLHGWFHSDVCVTAERAKSKSPVVGPKPHLDIAHEELRNWLTPEFIDSKYHSDMSTYFCSEGELNLMQFLRPEKAEALLHELDSADFEEICRPHRMKLNRLRKDALPTDSGVRTLLHLLRSEPMTSLMSDWTSLPLLDDNGENESEDGEPGLYYNLNKRT
ncbi:unnamed protein product [Gongylonema pulchrum]|uniref:Fe2OG dioxygenase domain-containing protein n=1 Tax=Gongylonema pulchrum TaxID=637853 RepID=A0A183DUB3_9BILA|nr:unnamed protein product [Gongylonema pulchrum]